MQAGTYVEFIEVFASVFLGMQLALSAYLQVCFSNANDFVMAVSLVYEEAEFGMSLINFKLQIFGVAFNLFQIDLMTRKPRNVRTERISNWRFFVQIYLVKIPFFFVNVHGICLNNRR